MTELNVKEVAVCRVAIFPNEAFHINGSSNFDY